jgi:NADH:ubiquinone oxidoreductase subunit 4 (subunit M)
VWLLAAVVLLLGGYGLLVILSEPDSRDAFFINLIALCVFLVAAAPFLALIGWLFGAK